MSCFGQFHGSLKFFSWNGGSKSLKHNIFHAFWTLHHDELTVKWCTLHTKKIRKINKLDPSSPSLVRFLSCNCCEGPITNYVDKQRGGYSSITLSESLSALHPPDKTGQFLENFPNTLRISARRTLQKFSSVNSLARTKI